MENKTPMQEAENFSGKTLHNHQESPTTPTHSTASRRFVPFIYLGLVVLEVAAMLWITWMRYEHQGLDPQWLAFNKTANLLGLTLALPFIGAFATAIFLPRLQKTVHWVLSLTLSSLAFGFLVWLSSSNTEDQPLIAVMYLAFKAIELAALVVAFRSISRPLWRKIINVAIFSLLIIAISYTLVISSVLLDPITPPPTDIQPRAEYDAGVILGAAVWSGDKPSPVFRERIKKGYELLKNGTVEFLVLTGGNAPNELTEAEVGKRELLKLGTDPTRIVLEEHTSSTVEQILFIRDELTKQGWTSFVIISDQFHLKRALEICAFNDIKANGISSESPLGPYNLAIYHLRESAALILYWMFGL